METLKRFLPFIVGGLVVLHIALVGIRSAYGEATYLFVLSSIAIFAFCFVSAIHLMGVKPASIFAGMAFIVGWAAEQIGTTTGIIFGAYEYPPVLGPRILDVPFVIPLMWFALVYIGHVMANLIVWQAPVDHRRLWPEMIGLALLTGFIVTAYDLAADPYMVHVADAWRMTEGGSYFGVPPHGFVGWVATSFVISLTFRAVVRRVPVRPLGTLTKSLAALPIVAYTAFLVFFLMEGDPPETKSIAFFAMGIPIIAAAAGWTEWHVEHRDAESEGSAS